MAGVAQQLIEQLDGVVATTLSRDDFTRQQLAMAARKLLHKLETKEEKTFRLAIAKPIVFSMLQVAIDVGHQLRLMAANHIIEETGQDRYTPTTFSLSMGDRSTLVAPALRIRTDHIAQCAMHWPDFLAKTDYRKPVDDKNSCYIDAFPEKKSFFERWSANPVHQESFSFFMDLWGKHKRPWPQFYDTNMLLEGANMSDGSAFIVDVGGHHTIDLLRVLENHPDLPAGSLVLEDLPQVVASVQFTTDKIRIVGHDLFGPDTVQPVKGSRAYYMHSVLHDWSDETSVKILKQVAAVMKPGYSKVLINEIVIPATGNSYIQAGLDCLVLQASANERTEAMWNKATLADDSGTLPPTTSKLHAKNGIEGFSIYFAPKSFREMTTKLNDQRSNPWVVRDYDAQVEFLFRDMETFYKGASDPGFQSLQAKEEPFISGIHAEVSIGWIETYVNDGKVVNIREDGEASVRVGRCGLKL
ncbi:MAG: hypothetical protein Q9171_004931 [Xanthocarpia ochracea]